MSHGALAMLVQLFVELPKLVACTKGGSPRRFVHLEILKASHIDHERAILTACTEVSSID